MAFGRKRTVVAGTGKPGLGPKPVVLPSERCDFCDVFWKVAGGVQSQYKPLPYCRKENAGQDPNVALVPKRGVWGALGGSKPPLEEPSSTAVEGAAAESAHSGTTATHSVPKPAQTAVTGPAWGGAGLPARIQEQAEIAKDVPDDPKAQPDTQRYMFGHVDVHSDDHGRPHDMEHYEGLHNVPGRGMVESRPDSGVPCAGAPAALPIAPPPPPPPRNADSHANSDRSAPYPRHSQYGSNQRRDVPPSGTKHPGFSPEGNFSAKVNALSGRGHVGRQPRRGGAEGRGHGAGRNQHAPQQQRSTSQASSTADPQPGPSPSVETKKAQQSRSVERGEKCPDQASAGHTVPSGLSPSPEAPVSHHGQVAGDAAQSMRVPQQPVSVPVDARQPGDGMAAPPSGMHTVQMPIMHPVTSQHIPQGMQQVPAVAAVSIVRGVPDAIGMQIAAGGHPHATSLPLGVQIAPNAVMQHVPAGTRPHVAPMHNIYPAQMGAMQPQMRPQAQGHAVQVIPQNVIHPVALQQHRMEQTHVQHPPLQTAHLQQGTAQGVPSTSMSGAASMPAAAPVMEVGRMEQNSVPAAEGRRQAHTASREQAYPAAVVHNGQDGSKPGKGHSESENQSGHGRGRSGARANVSRQDRHAQQERRQRGAGDKHERHQVSETDASGQRGQHAPHDGLGRGHTRDGRGQKEGRGRGRGSGRGNAERFAGDGAKSQAYSSNVETRARVSEGTAVEGRGQSHAQDRGRRHDAVEGGAGRADSYQKAGASQPASGAAQTGRGRGHVSSAGRGRGQRGGSTRDASDRQASAVSRDNGAGGRGAGGQTRNGSATAPVQAGKSQAERGKGAGRGHSARGGRHAPGSESVNVESAAAAAKAVTEAASVSVDIAPQVFTQALAKLEAFNIQDTPKVPTPSSSQRPTREAKGKRGHAKGRLHVDMKEKIKVSNSEAPL